MKFRVGQLNCKNNPKAVTAAAAWNCRALGLNEVGKIAAKVNSVKGYDTFSVPGARVPRRSSLSTQMLFHSSLTTTAGFGHLAADWSKPEKIAPGRWLYGIGFDDDLMNMVFHNHAAIDDRTPKVNRVKKAAEAIDTIGDTWRFWENEGYALTLTGDMNTRPEADSPGWRDMAELCRRMDLAFENVGLDWVVWNPEHMRLEGVNVHTRDEMNNVTDHPGLVARFEM